MTRLALLLTGFSLLMFAGPASQAQPTPPRWQVYAGCAAAYQANWQLRQASRAPDMSTMIKEQFEEFKAKAIGFVQRDLPAAQEDARRRVEDYIAINLDRFLALEQAGTLEAYIEQCPPE